MAVKTFEKDPDEILDYGFNLTRWRTGTESIVSGSVVVVPPGAVQVGPWTTDGTSVWAMVSGGVAGTLARLTFTAVTNSVPPRTFVRSLPIHIKER